MPTYAYTCRSCGTSLEVKQSFSDAPLTECPSCLGSLRKVFNSVGVVFKGSGFYRNDSRADARSDAKAGAGGKDGGSQDGSSSASESSSSESSSSGSSSSDSTPAAGKDAKGGSPAPAGGASAPSSGGSTTSSKAAGA